MKKWIVAVVTLISINVAAFAADSSSKLAARIDASRDVIHEIMSTPDKGIPLDIAAKAKCIAVVPGFKKGAFLIGGQYGQGVATCRTNSGWSAPVFIQLTGASFGFQAGGQSTDLIIVGVNDHSLDDLLKDKAKLGGDLAVAAGPVGRNSQASTTEAMNAEFLTYSRSKGLFAGVDLTGDIVHQNTDDTKSFYGSDLPYKQILSGGVPTPADAQSFVKTVNVLFKTGKMSQ